MYLLILNNLGWTEIERLLGVTGLVVSLLAGECEHNCARPVWYPQEEEHRLPNRSG